MSTSQPVVVFDNVSVAFDDHRVLDGVSFTVQKASMVMLLGASGAGKSVVLKLILGLLRPDAGAIYVNGQRIDTMAEDDLLRVRADMGMAFQEIALFDSLTVSGNVGYRLDQERDVREDEVQRRVEEVLGFVGLRDYVDRMPSELSGGQRRRVAIARAMASRPALLLLDDPTTGLDPITAVDINEEIVKLRDLEDVTSIMVTHQIRDAFYIAQHEAVRGANKEVRFEQLDAAGADNANFMVLHRGRIVFHGSGSQLLASQDEYVKEFLYMTLPPW
jgi:phospholipid/cholesterol/gamma-HCH transport system ATP-binding protein